MADEDREEEDRQAILRRRARLIGVALSSVVASTSATACACLSMAAPEDASAQDAGPDGGMDATVPQPCLSRPPPDAGPPDAATEDAATDAATEDAAADDAG
ncbi:MAG: hypothetical protein EVA89_06500 [Sandaracinaceae bacterium]|nr:MAG: hypothetical protein EVA89_06500 [Sandaracinaceae bacterium]